MLKLCWYHIRTA